MTKPCLPALISALISLGFVIVAFNTLQISISNNITWKIIASSVALVIFSSFIILNIVTIKKLRCLSK